MSATTKKSMLVVAMLFASRAGAAPIPADLAAHAAISGSIAILASEVLDDTAHPVLYSFGVALIPGTIKYVHDRQDPNYDVREKHRDMAANIVGALGGAIIGHTVFVYASHKKASIEARIEW